MPLTHNNEEWIPHQPATWPWRLGKVKQDTVLKVYDHINQKYEFSRIPSGTTVKIVMVSRLGDVGITDDLGAEYGYKARIGLDMLEQVR